MKTYTYDHFIIDHFSLDIMSKKHSFKVVCADQIFASGLNQQKTNRQFKPWLKDILK